MDEEGYYGYCSLPRVVRLTMVLYRLHTAVISTIYSRVAPSASPLILFVELPSNLVKRAGMNLSTLCIPVYSSDYFKIYTNHPWFSWGFGSKVLTLVASGRRRYVHVED